MHEVTIEELTLRRPRCSECGPLMSFAEMPLREAEDVADEHERAHAALEEDG